MELAFDYLGPLGSAEHLTPYISLFLFYGPGISLLFLPVADSCSLSYLRKWLRHKAGD